MEYYHQLQPIGIYGNPELTISKNLHFNSKEKESIKFIRLTAFGNSHDTDLFKKIENDKIDFNDYESCLLLTLRTIYNEIWRKEVNIKMYDCLIKESPDKIDISKNREQEKLGLGDLKLTESEIWNDIDKGTESYVFKNRKMNEIDLCLSAFYTYDTSEEIFNYELKHGKDMERISDTFINIFPYENQSILLKGYNKKDETKVKDYFYSFFKENEKRVQRKLTNLMLFQCETWVVSDKLFNSKMKGIESLFAEGVCFSGCNPNERQIFDLNIYKDSFKKDFEKWNKKYCCQQNL